jgi:hypothetical protein
MKVQWSFVINKRAHCYTSEMNTEISDRVLVFSHGREMWCCANVENFLVLFLHGMVLWCCANAENSNDILLKSELTRILVSMEGQCCAASMLLKLDLTRRILEKF